MNQPIDVSASQRKTILALLEKYLPNTTAWVYGSRVKWPSRPQSDLDLVVFATPEQHPKVSDLKEAFEESNLPFRVDLFVWDEIPEQFQKQIEADHVVLLEREERGTVDEWVQTSLGKLIDIKHGFAFKGVFIREEECYDVLLTPGNFSIGGGFKDGKFKYYHGLIPEEFILSSGDLLVTMTDLSKQADTLGYPAIVPNCPEGRRYLHNQRLGKVLIKEKQPLCARYLYYVMCSAEYRHEVLASATGTTVKHTSPERIKQFRFLLPPLPEQRAIAHVLGTLDDKIELNRRMNETLESMARSLFKSWFVDFDPVRAKSALKRHKSITPPLRGSRQGKGASPQASRWGAASRPHSPQREEIKRLYSPLTLKRAKALRQSRSEAEGLLWHYLRKKQLDGHKFRRQQPIGRYIVDFVCMAEKLVIELDGGQHSTQRAYDEQRDQFLTDRGYSVLRFWNSAIFENCYGVLENILAALRHDPVKGTECPPPQPADPIATPPQGGSDWTVERAKAYLDRMDPDIADLFPDRFVDSELGEIPEGWEVSTLGDCFNLTMGQSPPGHTYNEHAEGMPFFQGRTDFRFRYPERRRYCTAPTRIAEPDDTLVSVRAPVGDINMAWEQCCVGRGVAALRHKSGLSSYTFYLARAIQRELHHYDHMGTVFGAINKTQFESLKTIEPVSEVVGKFESIVQSWDRNIRSNTAESRTLTTVRDTLLPKLVSGEVRVKRAGKIVWSTV